MIQGKRSDGTLIETLDSLAAGEEPKGWNIKGSRVPVDIVIVQNDPTSRYALHAKLNGEWYELAQISQDDQVIEQLKETDTWIDRGYAPAQLEKWEQLEKKRQAQLDAYAEYQASRRRYYEGLRAAREAKFRRDKADQRSGFGG